MENYIQDFDIQQVNEMSKEDLIEDVLHARNLLFNIQHDFARYKENLKKLRSNILKEQSWDSVKELLTSL